MDHIFFSGEFATLKDYAAMSAEEKEEVFSISSSRAHPQQLRVKLR